MRARQRVVVAGAGLAGFRTARELRAVGFDGAITLLGSEPHLPYDRPPLSKQLLAGACEPAATAHTDTVELDQLGIEIRTGQAVTGLDRSSQTVRTAAGDDIGFDRLVIATGAEPRRLPVATPSGVHTLRTLDDAAAIRERLTGASRVVVVGGGLIAFEIASVASTAGTDVTIIEALDVPLMRSVGSQLGRELAATARDHGVQILCSSQVESFAGDPYVTGVTIDNGHTLPADLVVVAIGAAPAVAWLTGSGLHVTAHGVHCDASGAADPRGRVWAVGDAAAWWDHAAGDHRRHEHWTRAVEQSRVVASNLATGQRDTLEKIPYFWSDQFGHKIQGVGEHGDHLDAHVYTTVAGAAALYRRENVLTAAVAIDQPRLLASLRRLVGRPGSFEKALAMLPTEPVPTPG